MTKAMKRADKNVLAPTIPENCAARTPAWSSEPNSRWFGGSRGEDKEPTESLDHTRSGVYAEINSPYDEFMWTIFQSCRRDV